jgi:transcriptional regulator with XRE-family HTH domain
MPTRAVSAVDIHVGRRIRMARLAAGISQQAVAEALGLTFQQVQKYEKGANRIGAGRLYEIATVLNVSVSYFFQDAAGGVGDDEPPIAAITEAMSTPEGIRVGRALARIEDKVLRCRIADFLEAMVVVKRRRALA